MNTNLQNRFACRDTGMKEIDLLVGILAFAKSPLVAKDVEIDWLVNPYVMLYVLDGCGLSLLLGN